MKPGDVLTSKQGTGLTLTIKAITKKKITVVVERRIVDRKTGELTVEKREREVAPEDWPFLAAAYG